jgi:hypothetical protein
MYVNYSYVLLGINTSEKSEENAENCMCLIIFQCSGSGIRVFLTPGSGIQDG